MRRKQIHILACLLALSICISCTNKEVKEGRKTIKAVKVETITAQVIDHKLTFNASIKEKSLVLLSFRVSGPMQKLNVKVGDYVNKGTVIAQIDRRDYAVQLQATKAQFEQVEGEYQRYKDLYKDDKLPANNFEKIESGYLMAKSAYENAQNQYNDTELKAPFSGYIYQKMSENFQTIGAGMPVVAIIDLSSLEVVTAVAENQLMQVRNNSKALVSVKNAGVIDQTINLLSVGEKSLPNGLFEVKFELSNGKALNIAPGMSAKVVMTAAEQDKKLSIPSSAIFNNTTGSSVWLYDAKSHKVKRQHVELGNPLNDGNIEILTGLEIGNQIITAGVHALVEGQKVEPIKAVSKTNIGGLL